MRVCYHTNSGSLKDQWRTESASADNDLLACSEGPRDVLTWVQWLGWDGSNADCLVTLQDNLVNLGVALKVEVLVLGAGAVNVAVCGVRTTSSVTAYQCQPRLSRQT